MGQAEEPTSIFEKLDRIDRRIYYWILVVGLAVPFIMPLGLPISVKKSTKDLYEGIQQVEEGDVVLIDVFMSVSTWPECMPGVVIEVNQLMDAGAKIVITSTSVDIGMTWSELNKRVPRIKEEYIYGEDIVLLGYYAGGSAAVQQMAVDMSKVFPEDHFGTPVSELTLMQEANIAEDYRMVLGTAEGVVKWIQQWGEPYDIAVGMNGMAMKGSALQPYYSSGDLFGLAVGARGGAELEALYGKPGPATTRMDAISLSHIIVIVLILLANTGIFYRKYIKGEE